MRDSCGCLVVLERLDYNKGVVVDRLDTIFVHGRLVPRSGGIPALKGGNDDATEAEDGNGGQSRMGL